MRTPNHRTGQPFVIEDSITADYLLILQHRITLLGSVDQNVVWQRYTVCDKTEIMWVCVSAFRKQNLVIKFLCV